MLLQPRSTDCRFRSFTYDALLQQRLNQALYVTSASGPLEALPTLLLSLPTRTWSSAVVHFDHSYLVGVKTSARYKGAEIQAFPAWPSSFGDGTRSPRTARRLSTKRREDRASGPKKISGRSTTTGPSIGLDPRTATLRPFLRTTRTMPRLSPCTTPWTSQRRRPSQSNDT